jgi:hypothetical protein
VSAVEVEVPEGGGGAVESKSVQALDLVRKEGDIFVLINERCLIVILGEV